MSRFAIALVSASLVLPALSCSPLSKPKTAKTIKHGKATAPITITTQLGDGKATVTLRFDAPVEDASITLWGVDGLVVTSTPPETERTFKKGDTVTLDVTFTPGPGRSHLVVSAGGNFKGRKQAAVQSFAVGKPSHEQLKASTKNVITTTDGRRIKVMPVEQH